MKKISLIIFLFFLSISINAQQLDFSISAGTGKNYFFESIDKSVDVNYGLPLSLMTELKFTPQGKKWGIKLRVHNVQSTVTGQNWSKNLSLNGYINILTTSLLLENEIVKKAHSYGFNFGFGLTKETLQPQQYSNYTETVNYPSLSLGGHLTYKLNNELSFQILPTLLWQDPFKSIGAITGKRKANFADEDLTMLINFGVRYRLSK